MLTQTDPIDFTTPNSLVGGAGEGDSLIDLRLMREACDGSPEGLVELGNLYVEQMSHDLKSLGAAVENGPSDEVKKLAHKCRGSSAVCGMKSIMTPLAVLEHEGSEGSDAFAQFQLLEAIFEKIKTCLGSRAFAAYHNPPLELIL